jgi:hypothetical protein
VSYTSKRIDGSTVECFTVVETAKLLRKALKDAFPRVKFRVRSDSYAGGASIRVRYEDGPFKKDVEAVAQKFAGASFDGMIDLKSYHDSEYEGRTVSWGADYVFVDRNLSDAYRAQIEALIADATREPFDPEREYTFPMFWEADSELLRVATCGHWNRGYDMVHRLSHVVAPAVAEAVAA